MNTNITSKTSVSSVSNKANEVKSFLPGEANPDKIERALKAIQKRFSNLAQIINIDVDNILSVVLYDLYTKKYYEVYSNEAWNTLHVKPIKF